MLSERLALVPNADFTPTEPREILDKVAALPIAIWKYKSQDKSIRHIGPTAQDFHAAFNVGENDRTITTVDADGVALAAIQGLNQKLEHELKAKDAQIRQLQADLAEIKQLLQTLTGQ
jgi:trimeric autotransporter adhesin